MSMCLGLTTVSDRNIQKIVESPALVWRLLAPDDPEIYFDGLRSERSIGFLSRLFGRRRAPEAPPLPDLGLAEGEGRNEDLDKAWHALHYFFTGSDWEGDPPLNFLVIGGTEVTILRRIMVRFHSNRGGYDGGMMRARIKNQVILFDWGDTVMRNFPAVSGSMRCPPVSSRNRSTSTATSSRGTTPYPWTRWSMPMSGASKGTGL